MIILEFNVDENTKTYVITPFSKPTTLSLERKVAV